jgi:hypothetical protein
LNQLIDAENLPDSANYFYELYILDENNELIDIPVLISNYRDNNSDQPNLTFNYETSQLVRRFFIFDTISGITSNGGYKEGLKPSIVRYATDIKLSIALDPDKPESILKPMLWISYKEKKESIITRGTTTKFTYLVDYYQNSDSVWYYSQVVLVVYHVFWFFRVLFLMCKFSQINPSAHLGAKHSKKFCFKTVLTALDVWSTYSFYTFFFITLNWYVFYKWAESATVLLPSAF